jgi:cytochrome b
VHLALGYVFAALLVFRLLWGFIGTRYARFTSFSFSFSTLKNYLQSLTKRQATHYLGHNPVGAIAIFLLIASGFVISFTGIALDQEWLENWEDLFAETHELAANFMLTVVFVHILGVIVSSYLHHENLARSMVTGYKQGEAQAAIAKPYLWLGISLLLAIIVFLIDYLS